MYCKLICILYALLCGQNFILVKSGCYRVTIAMPSMRVVARPWPAARPMRCGVVRRTERAPMGMGGCTRPGVRGRGSPMRPGVDGVAIAGAVGGVHR
jgi:hypothetical protein